MIVTATRQSAAFMGNDCFDGGGLATVATPANNGALKKFINSLQFNHLNTLVGQSESFLKILINIH